MPLTIIARKGFKEHIYATFNQYKYCFNDCTAVVSLTAIGVGTAFERLSTGKRVNGAVDDAAGLAIGKDLESRVSGLNQAVRNVNDGISMVQNLEGAYDEVTTIFSACATSLYRPPTSL